MYVACSRELELVRTKDIRTPMGFGFKFGSQQKEAVVLFGEDVRHN